MNRFCECSTLRLLILPLCLGGLLTPCFAGTKTWDGQHDTSKIDLTVVYFVPSDRKPLTDWRDRVDYFCRRIEQFHEREFQGQSTLKTRIQAEPLISISPTAELRKGDANSIFFRTLQEAEQRTKKSDEQRDGFPILLVLSDINWRPLDDFYRLKPKDGQFFFEGNLNDGVHFPGAESGGARAIYFADRGVGWGLVSADGWRVPYRGSDCVIYHEGLGHTVGLPHPEPGNPSVMSLGQYHGWLSESWLDKDQKIRLGWKPDSEVSPSAARLELYTKFRAVPLPNVPRPGQPVTIQLDWPAKASVKTLRVRFQTAVDSPWIDVPQHWTGDAPETATLFTFDRATPVSYRVDAELQNGTRAELWGYLQVRDEPDRIPMPYSLSPDLIETNNATGQVVLDSPPKEEVDLLKMIDPATCWQQGTWSKEEGKLISPKEYGARLELPYSPPAEYRLTLVLEPLDEKANGLILGHRSGASRFATLINFAGEPEAFSAIENIDGKNVGNETTYRGDLLRKGKVSQVIVKVTTGRVEVSVDGRAIIDWKGRSDQLSLSDYWKTPDEKALFLGAYDCRYRFHRITLEPAPAQPVRAR